MIILEKKKIIYVFMCLIFSIAVYGLKSEKAKGAIEVVSTPITGKVIVLDAGHGRRRWRSS